ncbi:MAG: hypothetical protein U9Q34_03345, partial [Elusimicrobiota bacterium]|nr:hypothetical protein [Elusimicrobiota bacterium]
GWSKRHMADRIKTQFSSARKAELSDIIILNDSSLKHFHNKLNDLQKTLKLLQLKHRKSEYKEKYE